MLSVYPFSDGDAFGRDARRTSTSSKCTGSKQPPETWKRLWRGDVNLKQVAQVILNPLLRRKAGKRGRTRRAKPATPQWRAPRSRKAASSRVRSRPQSRQSPPRPARVVHLRHRRSDAKATIDYYGTHITEHSLPIRIEHINGANHNFPLNLVQPSR